jgi:hypothetical protein
MKLNDMCCEKANLEKSLIDRAHNEFERLRAQLEEKAEIRRFHELANSDEIEGRTILYYFLTIKYFNYFILKDFKAFRALTKAEWQTIEIEGLNAQLSFSISRITDLSLAQNELELAHELELKEKSDQIECM